MFMLLKKSTKGGFYEVFVSIIGYLFAVFDDLLRNGFEHSEPDFGFVCFGFVCFGFVCYGFVCYGFDG